MQEIINWLVSDLDAQANRAANRGMQHEGLFDSDEYVAPLRQAQSRNSFNQRLRDLLKEFAADLGYSSGQVELRLSELERNGYALVPVDWLAWCCNAREIEFVWHEREFEIDFRDGLALCMPILAVVHPADSESILEVVDLSRLRVATPTQL